MNPFKKPNAYHRANEDLRSTGGGYVDETNKRLTALEAGMGAVVTNISHLATKTELAELKTALIEKIGDVRTELSGKLGDAKSELTGSMGQMKSELVTALGEMRSELIKWVIATGLGVIGLLVAIGGLAFGLAKYLK
jgi:hypothetical protein